MSFVEAREHETIRLADDGSVHIAAKDVGSLLGRWAFVEERLREMASQRQQYAASLVREAKTV